MGLANTLALHPTGEHGVSICLLTPNMERKGRRFALFKKAGNGKCMPHCVLQLISNTEYICGKPIFFRGVPETSIILASLEETIAVASSILQKGVGTISILITGNNSNVQEGLEGGTRTMWMGLPREATMLEGAEAIPINFCNMMLPAHTVTSLSHTHISRS